MSVELKVPEVGESITEVQIGEWLKGEGERVAKDEPVVVIETDKVTVELPAPAAGRIGKALLRSGQTAKVGDVVGYLETGDDAGADDAPSAGGGRDASPKEAEPEGARAEDAADDADAEDETREDLGQEGEATPRDREGRPAKGRERPPERDPARAAGDGAARRADRAAGGEDGGLRVMPAARAELAKHGLEARQVEPSGPGGRLLKEDVLRHVARAAERPAGEASEEEIVPMTPLRRRIAERLVQSQQTTATLTTFNEVDLSAVKRLRAESAERFQERHGVKLGFMSFFVRAAVEALKRVPQVNAEVRGTDVVYRNAYHVGIAVGGGKGLVVPVLRHAERLGFAEIERRIADFGRRAADGTLTLDELQGGTFTISNGGVYGSLLSTPILNPPQSGILGLHGIQDRPVAIDGQVVIRPMMYVALSYDHRVIDGREAVTFLRTVKECVEDPGRILLEI